MIDPQARSDRLADQLLALGEGSIVLFPSVGEHGRLLWTAVAGGENGEHVRGVARWRVEDALESVRDRLEREQAVEEVA